MTPSHPPYDWIIHEQTAWPPHNRPKGPFGPTVLEVMRSCPLRCCFEASSGFERRTGFAARVGNAFHRTLQSLSENPPVASTISGVGQEARQRFLLELERQKEQKDHRPREHGLPWDEERINRAVEAIIVEAQRMCRTGIGGSEQVARSQAFQSDIIVNAPAGEDAPHQRQTRPDTEVEVVVKSSDGLFQGRVDYVERVATGTRLVDYKSAVRDDLPERYERQLQMYALLWHDTMGEWPVDAEVVYPFTGASYPVHVDRAICERIGDESRALISAMRRTRAADKLATPGDVCKACEFRPWCKPFWRWQAREANHMRVLEKATQGFEGEIRDITTVNGYWRLHVSWRNTAIRIVAPTDRFPQLIQAQPGMCLRALDMRLQGQFFRPFALVTEYSELFLLA